MPKPTTKNELVIEIQKEWDALGQFLASLTSEQMIQPGAIGDWSPKDVLAHLAEWQQMCLDWYNAGLRGETPYLPAEGFKWSQMPALNQKIFEKYRDNPLEDILDFFQTSYQQILEVVEGLSDEKLFKPGYFSWTKKTPLSSYIIPCTSSHYRWARNEMRKSLKGKKAQGG
jgi:hypothetical protein